MQQIEEKINNVIKKYREELKEKINKKIILKEGLLNE